MRYSPPRELQIDGRRPSNPIRSSKIASRPNRTGGVLVLVVLLLTLLLAMVAFAVDIGRVTALRAELQNGVDAGTLAAQLALRANPDDIEAAERAAKDFVRINQIGSKLVPKDSIQVAIGSWDSAARAFQSSNSDPDSVRVFARQDDESFIFGKFFGRHAFGAPAEAVATGKGSPLDIMMTLDLSGSMLYQGRIEALRASAPVFVQVIDELGNSDQIGVMGLSADPNNFDQSAVGGNAVLYASGLHPNHNYHVGVLECPLTKQLSQVIDVLSPTGLRAAKYEGWTGAGAALGDATHYLLNGAESRDKAQKVVVLMTDGHANRPPGNGPDYARQMATYAASNNVSVYTISLGNAADEELNQEIADMTGGKHFLAKGQSASVLTQALTEAFQEIIKEVKNTHLVK